MKNENLLVGVLAAVGTLLVLKKKKTESVGAISSFKLYKKNIGKLTKEDYSRRNENAARRMFENSKNESLTEEQHEAIAMLCTARHNLHSNKRSAIIEDDQGLKQAIITANIAILESGIEPMNFVGTDNSDYIDIDSLNEIDYEEEEYDSEYERISSELEILNSKIEKYLSNIDNLYNTNYAPTGLQRI